MVEGTTQRAEQDMPAMPPGRLGGTLRRAREQQGLGLVEIARRTGERFDPGALAAVEAGNATLSEVDIMALAAAYGLETGELSARRSRLVIDVDSRRLDIEGERIRLARREANTEGVLARYLAAVYEMRNVYPGTVIPLRADDLEVLGTALGTDTGELSEALKALMITRPEIVKRRWRTLRAGVLIPAVGILVGATAVGTLILVNRDDTPTPDRNPVTAPVVAPSRPAAPLPGATISATDPQVGLAPAATLDRGAAGGSDTGLIDPLVIEAPGP